MTRSLKESEARWPEAGEYGFVPLSSIMPNPLNPRTWIDDDETDLLAESIKRGGQREVATVRPATDAEIKANPDVRYVLTSGERRYRASLKAGAEVLEVRVRSYETARDEMLDLFMLNESRKQVSDLERALYIAKLAEEFGWTTQTEIAEGIGETQFNISRLMTVTRCSAKVQARMHPRIPEYDRLSLQVTAVLCNVDHATQDDLIERMPAACKTSVAQVAWIRAELEEKGIELPTRKSPPADMRRTLSSFSGTILHKVSRLLKRDDINRLFENTSDEEAEDLAIELRNALIELEKLVTAVEDLSMKEKPQTTLFPSTPAKQPTATQAPAIRPAPTQKSPPSTERVVTDVRLDARIKALVNGAHVRVEYLNVTSRRIAQKTVTAHEYLELWKERRLVFQVNKTSRPPNYPDGDALARALEDA